jgi:(2Fe-2S) ferredoxin
MQTLPRSKGGHRYSGVMIVSGSRNNSLATLKLSSLYIPLQILFPSGATLYYGRVSPNDIPAVVNQTILNGKIVAGLLRGGNNVVRDELRGDLTEVPDKICNKKGKTLLEW